MIDINTITASFVANKHNMDTYLYINILATHRTGLFPPSGRSQRWVWNRHDPILCSLRKRITRTHAIPYALQMNNSPERGPPTYSPRCQGWGVILLSPPGAPACQSGKGRVVGSPKVPSLGEVQVPPMAIISLKSRREGPSARLLLLSTLSTYVCARSLEASSQNSPTMEELST